MTCENKLDPGYNFSAHRSKTTRPEKYSYYLWLKNKTLPRSAFCSLLFIIWFIPFIIKTVPRSDTRNTGLHFVFPVTSIEWAKHLWSAMSLYSVINYRILLLINSQTENNCEECYHPDNIWLRFATEFMAFVITSKINRKMVKPNKTKDDKICSVSFANFSALSNYNLIIQIRQWPPVMTIMHHVKYANYLKPQQP